MDAAQPALITKLSFDGYQLVEPLLTTQVVQRVGQAGRTLRMSGPGFMLGKPRVSQKSGFHRVFIQSQKPSYNDGP